MDIALCAIGRMENDYVRDFINHYVSLGVKKFFIYDNNYDGEEHFEDKIYDMIYHGLVEVIDYRNRTCCQLSAYNDCYAKHGAEYDWIAFFDFDEYLILEKHSSLEEFLSDKSDFDVVMINWMVMTDNNLIHKDKRPLLQKFTTPMPQRNCVNGVTPENAHIKSICHGGRNLRFYGQPHVPQSNKCYNASGKKCICFARQDIDWDVAYLKHFTTKTIEEWLTRKMKVGTPDRPYEKFKKDYMNVFFNINERTPEKEEFMNNFNI